MKHAKGQLHLRNLARNCQTLNNASFLMQMHLFLKIEDACSTLTVVL